MTLSAALVAASAALWDGAPHVYWIDPFLHSVGESNLDGSGSIRHHRLKLHFTHLKRGHDRLKLWRLVRLGRRVMIGRTTLAVR